MGVLRILIVDDDPGICTFLKSTFEAEHHICNVAHTLDSAERFISSNPVDLVFIDIYLGPRNGIDLLDRVRSLHPRCYCVVMTAHISLETAARSVAGGAIEYVRKPLLIDDLLSIANRAIRFRASSSQAPVLAPVESVSTMVGDSPKMLEVYRAIARVAPSNVNVFITGASGTGKELVAAAIHRHSQRSKYSFTPVNCGSFTETILESELFGHEKGAFTGAHSARKGLIEAANGGTLFLDEITETSLAFQVKLLRVIQEQQVRRVGSNTYFPVDVRILAASNQDVHALIKSGKFREDLFYRLSVVEIVIPPLEERREDIPLLVNHFLRQLKNKNGREVTIDSEAVGRLSRRSWPGNVRELENTVQRLAVFSATGVITVEDLEQDARRNTVNAPKAEPQHQRLQDFEKELLVKTLRETHGNRSEAARRLGIERRTLYRKALRLGIDLEAIDQC